MKNEKLCGNFKYVQENRDYDNSPLHNHHLDLIIYRQIFFLLLLPHLVELCWIRFKVSEVFLICFFFEETSIQTNKSFPFREAWWNHLNWHPKCPGHGRATPQHTETSRKPWCSAFFSAPWGPIVLQKEITATPLLRVLRPFLNPHIPQLYVILHLNQRLLRV